MTKDQKKPPSSDDSEHPPQAAPAETVTTKAVFDRFTTATIPMPDLDNLDDESVAPEEVAPAAVNKEIEKTSGFPVNMVTAAVAAMAIGAFALVGFGGDSDEVATAPTTGAAETTSLESSTTAGAETASTTAPAETPSTTAAQTASTETTSTEATESTTEAPIALASAEFAYPALIDAKSSEGALGSGCEPASGSLPDGTWFGYAQTWTNSTIEFDLACLYQGPEAVAAANARRETLNNTYYATNDDTTGRSLPITETATGYPLQNGQPGSVVPASEFIAEPVSGAQSAMPFGLWIYVNNGEVTELIAPNAAFIQQSAGPVVEAGAPFNCEADQGPASPDLVVANIAEDDPDGGLNIRDGFSVSAPILVTSPNGTAFTHLGGCEVVASGDVWWQVAGEEITGWANAKYFAG